MGTDDMKPFINIKRPDDDVDMLKIEKKEINDEDYNYPRFVKLGSTDDFFKTGPKHKEMETKLAEFQTQKGLRIDDEEIQSIIDSQLQILSHLKSKSLWMWKHLKKIQCQS